MTMRQVFSSSILKACIFISLFIPNVSMAQSALTLLLCSEQIQGQSTIVNFEGCIDLVSLSETLKTDIAIATNFQSSTPEISPIRFSKAIDVTTPVWRQYLLQQSNLDELRFIVVAPDLSNGGQLEERLRIRLAPARVSAISMTLSETGQVVEVIAVQPGAIAWEYVGGPTSQYDLFQQSTN